MQSDSDSPFQLPSTGMRLESESVSVDVRMPRWPCEELDTDTDTDRCYAETFHTDLYWDQKCTPESC